MRLVLYFLGTATFCTATVAQDLAQLIQVTPKCALPCVLTGVQSAGCNIALTPIRNCVCPNVTLQSELSICVQKSCSFQDQILAVDVESNICASYPKESRSTEVRLVAITLSAITFPLVVTRCWSRWILSRKLWWDDGAAIAAAVFLAGLGAIEVVSAGLGFGKHYWNVGVQQGTLLLKLFYVVQIAYIFIQVFTKLSILLLYYRIFPRTWFKWATKIFIGFLVVHGFAFMVVIIFQCTPISSIWDRTIVGKCVNLTAVGYTGAVFSIVEDLLIILLPISELNTLNLGARKRISLILMFSIGSFACVTSMVRLKYLVAFSNSFDSTWDNVDVVIWSMLELHSALICACLPSLRPILVRYAPSVFKLITSKGKSSGESSHRMNNWKPSLGRNDNFQGLPGEFSEGRVLKNSAQDMPESFELSDVGGRDKISSVKISNSSFPSPSKNVLPRTRTFPAESKS